VPFGIFAFAIAYLWLYQSSFKRLGTEGVGGQDVRGLVFLGFFKPVSN